MGTRMFHRGLRPGDKEARHEYIAADTNRRGLINSTEDNPYVERPPAEIEDYVLINTLQRDDPTAQQRPVGLRRRISDYMSALLYKLIFIATTLPNSSQSTDGTTSVLGSTLSETFDTLRQVWDDHQQRPELTAVPQADRNKLRDVLFSADTEARTSNNIEVSTLDAAFFRLVNQVFMSIRNDLIYAFDNRNQEVNERLVTQRVIALSNQVQALQAQLPPPGQAAAAVNRRPVNFRVETLHSFDLPPRTENGIQLLEHLVSCDIIFRTHEQQDAFVPVSLQLQIEFFVSRLSGPAATYFLEASFRNTYLLWVCGPDGGDGGAAAAGKTFRDFIPWVIRETTYFDNGCGSALFHNFKQLRIKGPADAVKFIQDALAIKAQMSFLPDEYIESPITDELIKADFLGHMGPAWRDLWEDERQRRHEIGKERITLPDLMRWAQRRAPQIIRAHHAIGVSGGTLHAMQSSPAPDADSAGGGRGGGGYDEPEAPDMLAEIVGHVDAEDAIFAMAADGYPELPECSTAEQAAMLNQIEAFNGDNRFPDRQNKFPDHRNRASAARPCAICRDPTHWKDECPQAGRQHGGQRRAPGNAHRSRFARGRWSVNTNGRVTSGDNTGTPFTGGAALAHARGLNAADAAVSTIEWSPHHKVPAAPVYHATGLAQPFRRPRR